MAKCAFTAAELKHRLTLQAQTLTPDGQGGFGGDWQDVATVWAKIEPTKGWERMQAQKLDAPVTHKVLIRYRPGLTPALRALYQGRVLDIKEVMDEGERKTWHRLMCVETDRILNGILWQELGTTWEHIGGTWN